MDDLRQVYDKVLGKGPFPTEECGSANIEEKAHGVLILYLADIAGLASCGGGGLRKLSESDKVKFRKLASRSLFERCPQLKGKVSPTATPSLNTLIETTEQALLLILQALG